MRSKSLSSRWVGCAAATAVVLGGGGLAEPESARADHAPTVSMDARVRDAEGSGGFIFADVKRTGWSISVNPTRIENSNTFNQNECYSWEVKLVVARGHDPDKQIGPWCGRRRPSDAMNTRTVEGREGTKLEAVEIKFCKEPFGPCDKTVKSLPEHDRHASAGRRARTTNLMELSLRKFLQKKEDKYKPHIFDWSDDGCSAPGAKTWKKRFKRACLRHDFGYRNFGAGFKKSQWFDPKDKRRAYVDELFLTDMRNICDSNDWFGCGTAAKGFFKVVRRCGGSGFFRARFDACG